MLLVSVHSVYQPQITLLKLGGSHSWFVKFTALAVQTKQWIVLIFMRSFCFFIGLFTFTFIIM